MVMIRLSTDEPRPPAFYAGQRYLPRASHCPLPFIQPELEFRDNLLSQTRQARNESDCREQPATGPSLFIPSLMFTHMLFSLTRGRCLLAGDVAQAMV